MSRKKQKLQKTVLNVAKVARKISRHLAPATFSTIKVSYYTRSGILPVGLGNFPDLGVRGPEYYLEVQY